MFDGYKWGVGILIGVFGLAYLASAYGWGLSDDSQAQSPAQGFASSGGSGGGGRAIGRASVRSFGSGSRWSSSGHSSGK